MKPYPSLLVCGLVLAAAPLPAQTTPPSPSRPTPEAAPDEAIKLDPFVIREDDNVGYSAASTLAGTRLNTALRDVGAAISIVTPEFLRDTAATNLGELLSLTTATEIGGVSGNFAGGAVTGGRPDQSESRENPQGNNRVRGIGAATVTRDYFITDIPFDAYNSSGVTIARGPNSLLFGIGNPAGIIEGSLIQPQLRRNRTEIGARFGSENSYRGSLDLNRVLVKDRLAFRVATVAELNTYQQKPAFDRKRRGFISIGAVVRDGSKSTWLGKTSVRLSGEMGDSQSNPVNVIPPVNAMLNFFQPPNPAIAAMPGTGLDPRLVVGSPTFSYRPKVTVDNRGTSSAIVAANPGIGVPYFIQIPLVFDTANQSRPGYASSNNPALAGLAGMMGRIRWAPNVNGRDATDMFSSGTLVPTGFVGYTLQNRAIFDYRENLLSGGLNRVEQVFQVGNLALTQELFNGRGGFELAYDQQQTRSTRVLPFSFGDNGGGSPASAINIDVSQYLPNDQPNPNVGRPFISQQGITDRTQKGVREAFRATAFYRLDLEARGKKFFGIPLGNHTFTGLHTHNRNDAESQSYATGWTSATRNLNTDVFQATNSGNFRTTPIILQYLGPSALGANTINDVRITNGVTATLPRQGDSYNVTFFDFTNRRLATESLSVARFLNANSKSRQLIGSQSLSVKSDFFGNHLVGVAGWRWDHLRTYSSIGNTRNPDDSLNTAALRLNSVPNLDERGRNFT
jgi:outer membrane receptor protein involved in Fe transport